ncbi:thrombomodulin [Scophthalmus maximus]|uniref:Thrombomodulin n=1 Tax=Scophthalmus maximus TaxID=52904 RepID=A0A6A4RXC4_SCOMX|nr:thrombomodulin [Scophthalmus maximus]KAF0023114.1 hypothetical protein F2P81_023744 [Scophthalmus maximus]
MCATAHSLLVCALFLCGLEEALLSQRGHCAGNRCFVLLREPEDFAGAQRSCRDSGGQLLAIDSEQEAETLANALGERSGGSYWLELLGSGAAAEGAAAGLQNCSSVCASAGGSPAVSWKRCRDRLDGFLCQYTFSEPCGLLQAGGSAQVVRYTTARGFEVNDSETFPPGTIAAAGEVAGEYPDSKHVCFEGKWLRAPWRCEVLMGGCDHGCNSTTTTTHTCTCPAGQTLHPNSFSCAKGPCVDCAKDPCVDCAQGCLPEGDSYACVCASGYRLARDGRSCVDVDECEEADRCPAEGEECLNTEGGFECGCREGFDLEDGACMNVSICDECEHMCENSGGVFVCACRKGSRVSAKDPTKCEQHCAERDCLARCDNSVQDKTMQDCYCPTGYIKDVRNNTAFCTDIDECEDKGLCDHECEDLFGGYRCLCNGGFELHGGKCVPVQGPEEEGGSGSPPPPPPPPHTTPAEAHPAAVPSYIKTGSVLGIAVFMALCAVLLCVVVRNMTKRCSRFELSSFRRPDIDVFYLQQVTTETYKRLSFDKQFKGDLQRLGNGDA